MNYLRTAALCVLAMGLVACGSDDPDASFDSYYLTTSNNRLLLVSGAGDVRNIVQLTFPTGSSELRGMDVRPADRQLYVVMNDSRVFTLDPNSGAFSFKSSLTTPLNGNSFAVDFNPVVDRLRIISDSGQNLRVNVDTGATSVDTPVTIANSASSQGVEAAAYTNSFASACTTELYTIDASTRRLFTQAPPNDGEQVPVGDLGLPGTADLAGFDIAGANKAIAALTVNGIPAAYSVDLVTGAATQTAVLPLVAGETISGLAAVLPSSEPAPDAGEVTALVEGSRADRLDPTNFRLVSFNVSTSGPAKTCSDVDITGVRAGDKLKSLSLRPSDGKLYSMTDGGQIYRIDAATGVASFVSALRQDGRQTNGSFAGLDNNSLFGMDFAAAASDPAVFDDQASGFEYANVPCDRKSDCLRIVTTTAQNLFTNVDDGTAFAKTKVLGNFASFAAVAASNGFSGASPGRIATSGATVTGGPSLYYLNSGGTQLSRAAANAAATALPMQTGLTFSPAILASVSLDVHPISNLAVAAFTSANLTKNFSTLCWLDLSTGQAKIFGSTTACGENQLGTQIGNGLAPFDRIRVLGLSFSSAPKVTAYALTTDNRLVSFAPTDPNVLLTNTPVTGLAAGESLKAIDTRPSTRRLYGISNQGKVYLLNPATGAATLHSVLKAAPNDTTGGFASLSSSSLLYTADFNPITDTTFDPGNTGRVFTDLLKLTTSARESLSVRTISGEARTDDTLNNTNIADLAFTGNFACPMRNNVANACAVAPATTLFAVDTGAETISTMNPVTGVLSGTVNLFDERLNGQPFAATPEMGFDITGGEDGLMLAAIRLSASSSNQTQLYRVVSPTTGALRLMRSSSEAGRSTIGPDALLQPIRSLAIELK